MKGELLDRLWDHWHLVSDVRGETALVWFGVELKVYAALSPAEGRAKYW